MTIRKTISFTKQHEEWLKSRIASGEYASESEYVRDLIRRDQQANEQFAALKASIVVGLQSGVSGPNLNDIKLAAERTLIANGRLPPNPES